MYICNVELTVSETNRVKQLLLWGYWGNLEQLSHFAFNDHSKSSRKWSNTALVFSNQIVSISFSTKGMENENKIIPESVSLLDKLIFTKPFNFYSHVYPQELFLFGVQTTLITFKYWLHKIKLQMAITSSNPLIKTTGKCFSYSRTS